VKIGARWRTKWWIWAAPLAFALVNAVALAFHPGVSGAGSSLMETALAAETASLEELRDKEQVLASVAERADLNRTGVAELYAERFSTPAERLTVVLAEVRRLTERAGFEAPRLSYPEQAIGEHGLVRKAIRFQVDGSYSQLRTLMNLLEVSDLFLVLEQVGLRDADESGLSIDLSVTTLFSDPGPGADEGAS
jgi:hypothetical protein